jgi:Family of unknown function (DUF5683)
MRLLIFLISFSFVFSAINAQEDSLKIEKLPKNPKIAMIASSVLPGSGQLYNQKYLKAPFVWGAFVPVVYFFRENHHDYRIYSDDLRLVKTDTITGLQFIDGITYSKIYDISQLESKYNETRRKRDLWFFGGMIVWTLNIIDAYVDAELSNFDISEDLSMRIYPTFNSSIGNQYFAVNFQFYF